MQQAVLKYGPMAKYVVAAGTCASFGGVAAAAPLVKAPTMPHRKIDSKVLKFIRILSGAVFYRNKNCFFGLASQESGEESH